MPCALADPAPMAQPEPPEPQESQTPGHQGAGAPAWGTALRPTVETCRASRPSALLATVTHKPPHAHRQHLPPRPSAAQPDARSHQRVPGAQVGPRQLPKDILGGMRGEKGGLGAAFQPAVRSGLCRADHVWFAFLKLK